MNCWILTRPFSPVSVSGLQRRPIKIDRKNHGGVKRPKFISNGIDWTNMNTAHRFFLGTISRIESNRIESAILADSLVSCLVIGRIAPLHIGLMLAGAALTVLGYPVVRRSL